MINIKETTTRKKGKSPVSLIGVDLGSTGPLKGLPFCNEIQIIISKYSKA